MTLHPTANGAPQMTIYFDKQGNQIGLNEWANLYAADEAYLGDDTIDGHTVTTKYWGIADRNGNPSQLYRSFVRDADGEEVDGCTYRTEATALRGHEALCDALREMATDGGRPC